MSDSVNELKEKFASVQGVVQSLREDKASVESEIKTLQSSMDDNIKELLELTGKSTVSEAKAYYEESKKNLEEKVESLSDELSKYLDTYGEDDEDTEGVITEDAFE